jgi:hypothetical protein
MKDWKLKLAIGTFLLLFLSAVGYVVSIFYRSGGFFWGLIALIGIFVYLKVKQPK